MEVLKAIFDRRSTRGFDGVSLTESELKTLIDAALASPSAMNRQPWHFSFVTDKNIIAEFDACADKVLKREGGLLMGAPLFVIISIDPAEKHRYTDVDCGIAVENLALAAMGLGMGSVIVGMPAQVLESEEGSVFMKKMGVPDGNVYTVGIIIGHNTVTKEAHPVLENRYTIV